MSKRLNITVDEDIYDYVVGHNNRSAFINTILKKWRQMELENNIIKGLEADAVDQDVQEESTLWDGVLADGLENHD